MAVYMKTEKVFYYEYYKETRNGKNSRLETNIFRMIKRREQMNDKRERGGENICKRECEYGTSHHCHFMLHGSGEVKRAAAHPSGMCPCIHVMDISVSLWYFTALLHVKQ